MVECNGTELVLVFPRPQRKGVTEGKGGFKAETKSHIFGEDGVDGDEALKEKRVGERDGTRESLWQPRILVAIGDKHSGQQRRTELTRVLDVTVGNEHIRDMANITGARLGQDGWDAGVANMVDEIFNLAVGVTGEITV